MNKITRRSFLKMTGAAMAAGAFSACNSSEESGDAVIEVWIGWTEDSYMTEVFLEGIASFEAANPGITIKLTVEAWDDMINKAITGVAAQDVPNIVWGWDPVAYQGANVSLNEFIENDADFSKDDLYDAAWDYVTIDGEVTSIPAMLSPHIMFYNPTKLAAEGWDAPPTTIAELEQYVDEVLKQDEDGTITDLAFWPGMEAYVFSGREHLWPMMFGAEWYDEATGKFTLTGDETIEAFEWIRSFNEKYGTENIKRFIVSNEEGLKSFDTATGPYYNGTLSLWVTPPAALRINTAGADLGVEVAVTAPPKKDNGSYVATTCSWWMPKGCANQEETWKFMKYFASAEWQALYCGPSGDTQLPANKAALEELIQVEDLDWMKSLYDSKYLEGAGAPPRVSTFSQVTNELADMKDSIYFSDNSIVDILQSIEDRVNA